MRVSGLFHLKEGDAELLWRRGRREGRPVFSRDFIQMPPAFHKTRFLQVINMKVLRKGALLQIRAQSCTVGHAGSRKVQ